MAFIPQMQPYVVAGFEILADTPEWYRYSLGVMVAASFGVRSFMKVMKRWNGKTDWQTKTNQPLIFSDEVWEIKEQILAVKFKQQKAESEKRWDDFQHYQEQLRMLKEMLEELKRGWMELVEGLWCSGLGALNAQKARQQPFSTDRCIHLDPRKKSCWS